MKKYLPILLLSAGLLAGCPSLNNGYPKGGNPQVVDPASAYGAKADEILLEANRLAGLVNRKEITRVQAAQTLDRFRIDLVGHNVVDDAVFSAYLRVAVDRQNGKITAQVSQQRMQNELNNWQARWTKMKKKPDNPAFSNFLMQVFSLPPLK